MTTFLYNIVLSTASDKMAVIDPHGFTLTLVCVAVVFTSLLILWGVYSLIGILVSKSAGTADEIRPCSTADEDTAAAIAMALSLHLESGRHDEESGFITIRDNGSPWRDKALTLRRKPLGK